MQGMRIRRMSVAASIAMALACVGLVAGRADAHAHLIDAQPAGGSIVAAPTIIKLRFNEAVEAKLSSLKLSTGGREIAASPLYAAAEPATLALVPVSPLASGLYEVSWSVVSDDGHRTKGSFAFTVK